MTELEADLSVVIGECEREAELRRNPFTAEVLRLHQAKARQEEAAAVQRAVDAAEHRAELAALQTKL